MISQNNHEMVLSLAGSSSNRESKVSIVITIFCLFLVISGLSFLYVYFSHSNLISLPSLIYKVDLLSESRFNTLSDLRCDSGDLIQTQVTPLFGEVKHNNDTTSKIETLIIENRKPIVNLLKHNSIIKLSNSESLLREIRSLINSCQYGSALELIGDNSKSLSVSKYSADVAHFKAKALTGLYLSGSVSGPMVIEAWKNVKSFYRVDSNQFNEADSILALFGVK
jgi:hypothetical protein